MEFLHLCKRMGHPLGIIVMTGVVLCLFAPGAAAQVGTGTFRVDGRTGADSSDCGSTVAPCKSIQQAVNLASSGDTILVATGTYTYDASLDIACTAFTGKTAIVCVLNAELDVLGGYDASDWSAPDPVANLTVIDGDQLWRGVRVADTNPGSAPSAGLRMEGFTVRRGRAGTEVGADGVSRAFGGGFESLFSKVELRDMVFEDNLAQGIDTASGSGGWGLAGGVSIRVPSTGSIVERVRFARNEARGGSGPDVGGFAIGGGMLLSDPNQDGALLTINDLEFVDNLAAGGNSPGAPTLQEKKADAQGGAIAFQGGSLANVVGLTASGNTALGGDSNGYGGGAFGGAVFLERSIEVLLYDLDLYENLAVGGNGADGGLGEGGGLMAANSQFSLERSLLISNTARGGEGFSGDKGAPGGGGLALQRTAGTTTIKLRNIVVADNVAEESPVGSTKGGGGGGVFVIGADVELIHATIAGNRLNANSNQGLGLVLVDGSLATSVSVKYGIIANHTEIQGEAAVHVQLSSSITFVNVLFAGNEENTNLGDSNSGTFVGLETTSTAADPGFSSPGPPNFDYHLLEDSPAVDAATGSAEIEDFELQLRDILPDIGADELGAFPFFEDGFESGDTRRWSSTVGR